ncbi:hypothetical protein ABZZ17_04140 [Streptomyces sp. NPDC006512]|uniref:hypothetical protein n=1 Tax=Streptomyces sp. NPDC006512 TaxID=3154307 RepID=UPI0033A67702
MLPGSALLSAALATLLLGVPSASVPGSDGETGSVGRTASAFPRTGQGRHESALFGIRADNNAAAQEFTADGPRVTRVGLFLSSGAATGTVTVQLRTRLGDAAGALATRTLDLARLGGAGAGWVEFPLDARTVPGATYYLFAQASVPAGGAIAWHGTRTPAGGAPVSWNYDRAYWGGWEPYEARLAFYVDPTPAERCGETEPCYVPASALSARTSGLLSNGTSTEAVAPAFAVGARYVDGSNVLRLPSGRWRYLPRGESASVVVPAGDAGAQRQITESRNWLAAGITPGRTAAERSAAGRALLSMRALLRPNGAYAAAWAPAWQYAWPRDSSFAAAAFAHTGHEAEALAILRYSARTQRTDGTWEARTKLDGSGPPDARAWQLDANGWVPWAVWQWYQKAPQDTRAVRLQELYPMIRRAADRSAASLDGRGLPPASPDYWELPTGTVNIGTAAPLLAGLNASADLAGRLGETDDAARWNAAAKRLSAGIAAHFAPLGYPRTLDAPQGRDSAAAFMAPPFNAAPAGLPAALDSTERALKLPNGGLTPGNGPGHSWGAYAWTASTSFFALAWAGLGRSAKADGFLGWVLSKRNTLGELPETVNGSGRPSAVAPLGWTGSLVALSLLALDGRALPTPPLRG